MPITPYLNEIRFDPETRLVMGLAFVTGAIGIPITGAVADHLGLQAALALQVAVVIATVPLALLLPSEHFLRRLRESRADQAGRSEPARVPAAARPASANH